jgi:hypothetical protein
MMWTSHDSPYPFGFLSTHTRPPVHRCRMNRPHCLDNIVSPRRSIPIDRRSTMFGHACRRFQESRYGIGTIGRCLPWYDFFNAFNHLVLSVSGQSKSGQELQKMRSKYLCLVVPMLKSKSTFWGFLFCENINSLI